MRVVHLRLVLHHLPMKSHRIETSPSVLPAREPTNTARPREPPASGPRLRDCPRHAVAGPSGDLRSRAMTSAAPRSCIVAAIAQLNELEVALQGARRIDAWLVKRREKDAKTTPVRHGSSSRRHVKAIAFQVK